MIYCRRMENKVISEIISQLTKQPGAFTWILLDYSELNKHSKLKIVASGNIFSDLIPLLYCNITLYGLIQIADKRILFEWCAASNKTLPACETIDRLANVLCIDQKIFINSQQNLETIISKEYISSFFYSNNENEENNMLNRKSIHNDDGKPIGTTSILVPEKTETKSPQPTTVQLPCPGMIGASSNQFIENLEINIKTNFNRRIDIQTIEQAQLLPENKMKIIVIGESGVGKTYITRTYIHGKCLNEQVLQTVGAEVSTKIAIINGYKLKLEIWDTMGQEKYGTLVKTWFRFAQGAIIVYDITELDSYEMVYNQWIDHVLDFCDSNVVVMLVGNKTDLENDRQVSYERASNFATERNFLFNETCGFNAHSCKRVFEMLAYEMTKAYSKDLENLNCTPNSRKEVVKLGYRCNVIQKVKKSKKKRRC